MDNRTKREILIIALIMLCAGPVIASLGFLAVTGLIAI
jgi:hypothetical protein